MAIKVEESAAFLKSTSQDMLLLYEHLSPFCEFKQYPVNTRFRFFQSQNQQCYFIRRGLASLYYSDARVLLSTFRAPCIVGLSGAAGIFSGRIDTILIATSQVEIAQMSLDKARDVIAATDSWRLYVSYLERVTTKLYIHLSRADIPDAYSKVWNQLVSLMNEPVEYRRSVKAHTYLTDTTQLSRSGIFKILARLRKDNIVIIEDGFLVKINELDVF